MSELPKQLRKTMALASEVASATWQLHSDAADEIERLERERAEILSVEAKEVVRLTHSLAECQAQAAAMREALINAKGLWGHLSTDATQQVWLETVNVALSPDAGKAVLRVVEAAERVEASRRWVAVKPGQEIKIEVFDPAATEELREALAALDGRKG